MTRQIPAHRLPRGQAHGSAYHSGHEPGLWSDDHQALPLQGIHVDTDISYPVALTRLTQHYRNTRRKPIEARYVFPVPVDALITALEIRIGERTLKGVVKAKQQAERDYEDAIVKGDSGFLLTRLDDGLYQISVGNLQPKEEVHLTVHWAELLRWNGNEIRYRLPNLVGPTYGDPQRAGIAPADAPTTQAGVRHPFSIAVSVTGALAAARCASPSHALAHQALPAEGDTPARLRLTLQGRDVLDRAFVLQLIEDKYSWPLEGWQAPDGEHIAVLAALHLWEPDDIETAARHLTLVVDCSGSMAGVSIQQAREAALGIIEQLRAGDTLSLVRFGSDTEVLTPQPLPAGAGTAALRALCPRLEANMGGTEMQEALQQALRVTPAGGDLMLITDGECYFSDADIARITRGGHRLFTIGVGNATSEKVLRRLAEASGGFCELVSPGEDMAGHIVSHFRRLRLPRLSATAEWPGTVLREQAPTTLHMGDTAVFSAVLADRNKHEPMTIQVPEDIVGVSRVDTPLDSASGDMAALLPRLVAWLQLPRDNVKEATAMAVKYQLVTEHTSMIAVLARGQDPADVELPEVVEVPQMMPAGMVASFCASPMANYSMTPDACMDFEAPAYKRSAGASTRNASMFEMSMPSFLRRATTGGGDVAATPQAWVEALVADAGGDVAGFVAVATARLPEAVKQALTEATGADEDTDDEAWQRALLALLALVLDALPAAKLRKLRAVRQWLIGSSAKLGDIQEEQIRVTARFAGLMADYWG